MTGVVHRHAVVADLCYHAKLTSTLRQGLNTVDQTVGELEARNTTVVLTGKQFDVSEMAETSFAYASPGEQKFMKTKLRNNASDMVFPLLVSNTMRIPLQNHGVKMGALDRIEVLTLRARPSFHGKTRYDNLMLLVECDPHPDGRDEDIVYGRCVAFYQDKAGDHFVAVHWYESCPSLGHFDASARLGKVQPMNSKRLESYDIMPVGAILNGALLVQDRGLKQRRTDVPQYWIRQSSREYNFLLHFYGLQRFRQGESQLQRDRLD